MRTAVAHPTPPETILHSLVAAGEIRLIGGNHMLIVPLPAPLAHQLAAFDAFDDREPDNEDACDAEDAVLLGDCRPGDPEDAEAEPEDETGFYDGLPGDPQDAEFDVRYPDA
jgi:hypothetical protein